MLYKLTYSCFVKNVSNHMTFTELDTGYSELFMHKELCFKYACICIHRATHKSKDNLKNLAPMTLL